MLGRLGALTGALAIVLGASPVLARDCNSGPFAGFYVGGTAGYAHGDADVTPLGVWELSNQDDSVQLGAHSGYNWQCGNVVFGIETDANWVDLSGTRLDPVDGSTTYTSKVDYFGTLRGRLGMTLRDTTLLYATAGFAYADVDHRLNAPGAPGGAFFQSDSRWATGWTLGGGLEFLRDERWIYRAEALYVDLGDKTESYTANFCGGPCTTSVKWDDSFWTFRLGASVKLGQQEKVYEPLK